MPRQLDKLNPHMDGQATRAINNYEHGYTDEEYKELLKHLNGTEDKDVLKIKLGKQCKKFVFIHSYLSAIMGPVGSGKSTGSILKILLYAMSIMPGKNGKRKSRWLVIRNTKPQLKNTTIKTFLEWIPDGVFGRFEKSTLTYYLDFDDVEAEIQFLALDDAKDMGKLLSLECTGIYFNELSEIDQDIYTRAQQRIGRYPSLKATGTKAWWDLEKVKQYGIIIDYERQYEDLEVKVDNKKYPLRMYKMDCIFSDTNPPLMGSYMQKMFDKQLFNDAGVDENPPDFELFVQPDGMSPYAENKKNLKSNYYEDIIKNSPKEVSDQMVYVKYGLGDTGLGVFRSHFKDDHIYKENDLKGNALRTKFLNQYHRIVIGIDFGLTPAICIGQVGTDGKLRVFDEVFCKGRTQEMHLKDFLDLKVEPFLQKHYPFHFSDKSRIIFCMDPAGLQRGQVKGDTAFRELKDRGYLVRPDSTNKLGERLGAVKEIFKKTKLATNNLIEQMFQISATCSWMIAGFKGNYYYEKLKNSFQETPCKNDYSHIQDAFQYLCVHIEQYGTQFCIIDNISRGSYNERQVFDTKIGY